MATKVLSRDARKTRGAAALTILALAALLTSAALPSRVSIPTPVDLSGKRYELTARHKPAVFIFLASDCPVASRTAPRIARIAKEYERRGVSFYAVYPNITETPATIRRHANARGLAAYMPLIADSDGSITRALHATTTPEAVLLDAEGTVRYHGRIDDGDALNPVRRRDLALALDAVLAGKPVAVPQTRAFGCALRFKEASIATTPTANAPTYSRDVAPILDQRCVECHRAGEVGPMPLDSYKQAASWAKAIKDFSIRRTMPPWKADSHGEFLSERRLSDAEIQTLSQWADAGAPEGNPADLPKVRPTYPKPGDWKLGKPDSIFTMPVTYTVPTEGKDIYRCFVIPTNYDTDKWVSSIEFQPDNRAVVHHINVFLDTSGKARQLDAADPAPGYLSPSPGNVPGFNAAGVLGGWIPGHTPWKLPDGVGNLLPRGADIVLEIHYITTGKLEQDHSRFGIRFVQGPVRKRLRLGEVTASGFRIPAGVNNYSVETSEFVRDNISLLSMTPHMHYLGKKMSAVAEFPDGTSLPLVTVPDWDFSWQMSYRFKEPLHLPRNTRIDLTAIYDNSAANPRNPHKPPQEVRNGESTASEMCNLFVAYTLDDEDLTKK